MTENKDVAKRVYENLNSLAKGFPLSEDDFKKRLEDEVYAEQVYDFANERFGAKLLDAPDKKSFLDSLGFSNEPLKEEDRIKVKTAGDSKVPKLDSLKIDVPKTMDIPQVKPMVDSVEIPQLELSSFGQVKDATINPEQTFNIKDIVGESPQQRLQAEINSLGEDAVLDGAKASLIEEKLMQQMKAIDTANEKFIKEYESKMSTQAADAINVYSEGWSPMDYRAITNRNKKDLEFIKAHSADYKRIQDRKNGLQRQLDLVRTYKQYADFGESVAKGERLSAMVSDGKITQDTYDMLRSRGSEKAKEQLLERLYNSGDIDKETLREIYNLGDLTDKSGFAHGLFKTGKIEDMATFGMNEIARMTDIVDIANRVKRGIPVTDEEMGVLEMYDKLAQIQKKASEDYGFGFKAGQGMQESLRFVVEMALTGGVGAGKQLGLKGAKALIEKEGFKKAKKLILGRAGKLIGESALDQIKKTPFSPSMYRKYMDRVTGMTLESNDELTAADKIGALYKSYVETFAERFLESLGNIASDIPYLALLTKGKATKDLTNAWVRTLAKITQNNTFEGISDALKNVGIAGIPEEVLSEMSGTIMSGVLTFDPETLKELGEKDFYKQVALQSVIMGGAGSVMKYVGGGTSAAIDRYRNQKDYEKAMQMLQNATFADDNLEMLRKELIDAIHRQDYVSSDASSVNRSIADIMVDLNRLNEAVEAVTTDKNKLVQNTVTMGIVDRAVRAGAFNYGEQQAIKSYVESKIGEYENEDGRNVYVFKDKDGQEFFMLDRTDDSVVLINRATGEKEVKAASYFNENSFQVIPSDEFAMKEFLANVDTWSAEDAVAQLGEQVQNSEFVPAVAIDVNGKIYPVKSYDANSGTYTITDENGEDVDVDPKDNGITEIFGKTQEQKAQEEAIAAQNKAIAQQEGSEETPVGNGAVEEKTELADTGNGDVNTGANSDVVVGDTTQEEQLKYDEKGEPIWRSASAARGKQELDKDFEAEDALSFVKDKVKEAEKELDKANKKKPKALNKNERLAEIEQLKKDKNEAQANLDYWKEMEQLYVQPVSDTADSTKSTEGTADKPVVDDSRDNPADARERGFRMVEGVRYDRQQPSVNVKLGNETDVKFADGVSVKGRRAIIDVTEAQPSHINGARNPKFLLDEAQPKDRTDKVSIVRADRIAKSIRPDEITGGATAYTGSPVLNTRKETIQGNGRVDALKKMYELYPEQAAIYKQYLVDHATEWGFDPAEIAAMDKPVLVDMLDVTDEQAIQLGQRTAQDIESGGEQKLQPQNIAQVLGKDVKTFANILLKSEDEDADLNDVVTENGYETLKWLTAKKVITETQFQTALDEKNNITTEAREALKDVLSQIIFQGGNNNIRKQFKMLPKAAQKALLQTIAREFDSEEENGILKDVQEAIEVYAILSLDPDFKKAKTAEDIMFAALSWAKQMQMDFTEGNFVPEDRYSNFAIALAVTFKSKTMKQQSAMLNQLYDYLQAEGGDIFNPAVRLSKEEAVKQVYGVELNKKKNETNDKSGSGLLEADNGESSTGGQGSSTDAGVPESDKQNVEQADNSGASGTSDSETSTGQEAVEELQDVESSEEKIEITAELIDSLPIDDVMKSMAKQYLNGKVNKITTLSFKAVEDYVQNKLRNGAADSSNANTAQLGSSTNDASVQGVGTDGGQSGPMDRGQSDGDVSAERPSGENSEGGLFDVSGEGSDNGVEQPTSDESTDGSTGRTNSSRSGSKRGNVRKPRGSRSSDGVSTEAGQQGDRTQSIDDKIKSADDLLNEGLAEIDDIIKGSMGKLGSMGSPDMFKLIPPVAKVGYALTKKGFYTFAKWFSQMQEKLGPLLRTHFTIEEIDELIRDMWDTEFTFNGETHTVQEWASIVEQEELRKMIKMSLEEKKALQQSREDVKVVLEDLDNIRESLPFLLPQQQEDVYKAEVQFYSESHKSKKYGNGKGILFTNGTGTGKTYTGLGIVKRFVKQGKGRILIVTAQDKKIKDWIRDASNLGIEATQLKDTKDKGKGVVVTQFANMYQNRALLEDEWDLIVYDESHKLMENQDGSITSRAVMHHLISNRDIEQAVRRHLRDHELFKKELELMAEKDDLIDVLKVKSVREFTPAQKELYERYDSDKDAIERRIMDIDDEVNQLHTKQIALIKETLEDKEAVKKAQASVDNTKVVFLSATPFNTAKNLDYVESYIFSYNPEEDSTNNGKYLLSEMRDKDRNNFVLEKFPSSHYKLGNGEVRMRSEAQIANPEKSSQEETDFSDELQELGTVSGRTLDSEWDYSRQFPKLNFEQAAIFNRMYSQLKSGKYAPLLKYFKVLEDYSQYTEYFEAIKTALSLDRIKQHVELGRKVVVFHRRRSNTTRGGFVGAPISEVVSGAVVDDGRELALMDEFEKEFADYLAWERSAKLDFANYAVAEAFATEEEKAKYKEDLKKWEQKAKESIAKGKKAPDRPVIKTKAVAVFNGSVSETEKRAAADAFNDNDSDVKVIVVQVASGKEGVDLHDKSGKFPRAEVNLYLPESPIEFIQAEGRIYRIGNKSNAVFEYPLLGIDLELASFAMKINGRAQTSENLALGSKSRGLRNSIARAALSSRGIDVSTSQGVGGKDLDSKSEQTKEDFDTAVQNYNEWKENQAEAYEDKQVPDPIGERMATWAMAEPGDNVLVPYAAEGSVARYVNPSSRLVAYEGRMERFARLAMLCGGSGRKVENIEYSGENGSNNDNILYFNPDIPEIEAQGILFGVNRVADSGRMVILTTAGDILRKNLQTRYKYDNNIIIRAEVKLPPSIMGINKNKLELIIIDNLYNEELQKQAKENTLNVDLSDITDETKLWEALRGIQIPARIIDNIAKTRKRAEKGLAYIADCPTVKKRTDYSVKGKSKLVPSINKSNTGCSFSLKRQGFISVRYADFTKGNPKYSPRIIESWAESWVKLQDYIKINEGSDVKMVIERVQEYKALCNFIEALLDKTPPQLKNLALGISENVITGEIDVPTLKDSIKGMLNNNAALERLNDRVMKVAEAFGVGVEIVSERHSKFASKSSSVQGFYSLNDNKIWIKEEFINATRHPNEKKAEVLLHEAIHSVTSYALEAYKNGLISEDSPLYNACKDITEVYEAIKNDPTFVSLIKGKDGLDAANNEYGLSDIHEMMAELANPAFRAALKAKKLWRQLINGIKRILGIEIPGIESEQTDALNVLENALDVLLDHLDVNTFNRYKSSGLFAKMLSDKGETIDGQDIILCKVVEDAKVIQELEASPKRIGYRNVVQNEDGSFSSPMANELKTKGKEKVKTSSFELGKWEMAEENPQLANENGKITLVKPNGNTVDNVDYNPYIHNRLNAVNAQFKDAWKRPDLVYVETEVPTTDLESGYQAEKAAKPVGIHKWSNGALMLSRYDKPVRILSWEEVANDWIDRFKDRGVEFDIVPPALLPILSERGIEILPPHKGMGQDCFDAYNEWKEKNTTSSERSDAVTGNSSSEGLSPVGSEHLSHNPHTQKASPAKIAENTNLTKRAIKKLQNKGAFNGGMDTAKDAVRELATALKLGKSKKSLSYYSEFYEGDFEVNGRDVKVRLSAHPARGDKFGNQLYDDKVSIVIYDNGEHTSKGMHNGYTEYVYYPSDISPENAAWSIVDGIKSLLNGDGFVDNSGKAIKQPYPYKAKDGSVLYRQSSTPLEARLHSEEVMRESIDKMADKLGVTPEYVYNERNTIDKGWYDPKTGKVVINLAAHETIEDARQTYLHEVVGHYGLRGLLKEDFEAVMEQVFDSLPKEVQDELSAKYKDKTIAAEEYLSTMVENDIPPTIVVKVMKLIRDALRKLGIMTDEMTNGDLQYLLWRSKNNLKENAGHIEAAKWGAKNAEMRRRSVGRPAGYSTNNMKMTHWDKVVHDIQDRMRPVKKLMDEIINRGGTIDESSDPWSQENLSTARAAGEIEDFMNKKYAPLSEAIAKAMQVFTEKLGMTAEDARKAVDDYLYARHAPERNKRICVNEITEAAMGGVAPQNASLVDENFKAEMRKIASMIYDNQFKGGKNKIDPTKMTLSAAQAKLAIILAGVMQTKAKEIANEMIYDENIQQKVVRGNNRSGMTDAEAEAIMNKLYNTDTASVLDEVSAKVKDCTRFTLDKWLEYGLISKEQYDTYNTQYNYYIPLRGWEDKAEDIDYLEIPTKQFNAASELVSLNRKAKGRADKAADPLANIASLAQSACVTGNRNLIRQKAFNMVANNESRIADLAVIENTFEVYDDKGNVIGYTKIAPSQSLFDQGRVKVLKDKSYEWHKTNSQLAAHRVPVMINGVRHVIYFKGEIGALAATAINGTDNITRSIVTELFAKMTRWISSNLTAKNVYFLTKNMARDLGFGNFAYFVENGFGSTFRLNRYWASALRTAALDAMGADPAKMKDYDLYQEFKLNGGQTGYVQLESVEKLGKEMNRLIDKAAKNKGMIAQGKENMVDIAKLSFDVMGKASENAMRFAIYKLEREKGASPREAAIRAKEITVNFNRQGTKTKGFSSVYAFFNPAIQGAFRYFNLAYEHPTRFIAAVGAMIALKFGLGMINELFSGGDDDDEEKVKGESAYDRLSDYVKATNIVIPLGHWGENGDGKFLCLPLPQSLRGTTYIADLAVDMVMGKKDFGEAMKEYILFNIGEFAPLDIDAIDFTGDNPMGTAIQALSPTLLRPVVEVSLNRDFMGNPISKTPYIKSQDYIPGYKLAFETTSPILVGTTKFLNELAGGDDNRSAKYQIAENGNVEKSGWGSFMDMNPANMEHLFSGYFGGMFKPFMDTWDMMSSTTDDARSMDVTSVTLANQFIKGPTSKPGYKEFYEMRDEVDAINSMLSLYKNDYMNENYIPLHSPFNVEITTTYEAYSGTIDMLNSSILMLRRNSEGVENAKEEIKELTQTRDKYILEASQRYRDICERRDKENKQ